MDYSLFAFITGILCCFGHLAIGGKCLYSLIILRQIDNQTAGHRAPATGLHLHILEADMILTIVFSLLMSVASGLLVIGVKKERHRLVHPWLILSIVWIVGEIIILLTTGYILTLADIISHIIAIVIQSIVWYPVYQFYKELDDIYASLLDSNQLHAADYASIASRPITGLYQSNFMPVTLM